MMISLDFKVFFFCDMLSPLVCSAGEAAPLSFSLGATWLGDLCLLVHAASSIEPGIDVTQFNLSAGVINQRITVGCQ